MSYADALFVRNCARILRSDLSDNDFDVRAKWADGTPAHTRKILYAVDTYDLQVDAMPMMTLRKAGIKNAIDEILWIYQKKTSNLSQLHSHIWDSWDVGDGTIGKAYGYQIGKKSQYKDSDGSIVMRDQIDQVIWDLKNNPSSRSILTNTYCHEDLHAMGLRPCAYMMTFNVTKRHGKLFLNAMLNQRSQDMLTANNWNVSQYVGLVQMLAQVTGMLPGIFTHVVADMHIYDRHIPIVTEMIKCFVRAYYNHPKLDYKKLDIEKIEKCMDNPEDSREYMYWAYHIAEFAVKDSSANLGKRTCDWNMENPKFWINPEIKDFYDFTPDDLKLIDYKYTDYNPKIEIAV